MTASIFAIEIYWNLIFNWWEQTCFEWLPVCNGNFSVTTLAAQRRFYCNFNLCKHGPPKINNEQFTLPVPATFFVLVHPRHSCCHSTIPNSTRLQDIVYNQSGLILVKNFTSSSLLALFPSFTRYLRLCHFSFEANQSIFYAEKCKTISVWTNAYIVFLAFVS